MRTPLTVLSRLASAGRRRVGPGPCLATGLRRRIGDRLCETCVVLVLATPACAQVPAPAAPASPLDGYAEAAATTIIAEQACPGVQVKAGQLTTLRLSAKVNAGQEALLQEKLRARATQIRQQLAADGREAWCAGALAAFGPQGGVARGILATGGRIR